MASTSLNLFLVSIFYGSHSYYVSPNLFNFDQGNYFCKNHCNSNLASIHNDSQFQEAIKTINDSSEIISEERNVWIGLMAMTAADTFLFTDGTAFDYGTNISGGVHPWKTEEPKRIIAGTSTSRICVYFEIKNGKYLWEDGGCRKYRRVLCNHCNGKFNKYIAAENDTFHIDEAIHQCDILNYPSSLASFHGQTDFEELRTLCRSINANMTNNDDFYDCWTGLFTNNGNDWINAKFYDNTTFDYGSNLSGGVYPWGNNQPIDSMNSTETQTMLHHFNHFSLWDIPAHRNKATHQYTWPICNMPSALCFIEDNQHMTPLNDCEYKNNGLGWQIMGFNQLQWFNGDESLRIELTFRISDWKFEPDTSWYALGLQVITCRGQRYQFQIFNNTATDLSAFAMGYYNGSSADNIDAVRIDIDPPLFDTSVYYTIAVNITRIGDTKLQFNATFKDTYFMHAVYEHPDNDVYDIHRDGYSGYIYLHTQSIEVEFKSLYVSGTPVTGKDIESCPIVPPSKSPSETPSESPSEPPSKYPSEPPSKYPSEPPSKYPSELPSGTPSEFPSQSPSGLLSQAPSVRPTKYPSASPSLSGGIVIYIVNVTIIIKAHPSVNITVEILNLIHDKLTQIIANDDGDCLKEDALQSAVQQEHNITIISASIEVCDENTQQELLVYTKDENLKGEILAKFNGTINVTVITTKDINYVYPVTVEQSNEDYVLWAILVGSGIFLCCCVMIVILVLRKMLKDEVKADKIEMSSVKRVVSESGISDFGGIDTSGKPQRNQSIESIHMDGDVITKDLCEDMMDDNYDNEFVVNGDEETEGGFNDETDTPESDEIIVGDDEIIVTAATKY